MGERVFFSRCKEDISRNALSDIFSRPAAKTLFPMKKNRKAAMVPATIKGRMGTIIAETFGLALQNIQKLLHGGREDLVLFVNRGERAKKFDALDLHLGQCLLGNFLRNCCLRDN